MSLNASPNQRRFTPHYSPAIVRRRPGDGILAAIEIHRRRTGWQGPVILVPA